jgi:2,3-dihydroxybenzoate-AMP ligase
MLEGCTPWPPEFADRYRRLGYWLPRTLGDEVDDWAARYRDRIALVGEAERVSYRELRSRVDRLSLHLLGLGLGSRDRVVVQLPTSSVFVYLFYALAKIGAIPVMALPAHRETEIAYLAKHSEAVAYAVPGLVRGFDYRQLAANVRREAPRLRAVLVAGGEPGEGNVDLDRLVTAPNRDEGQAATVLAGVRPDPSEVALFLLSGGTTGLPKLIPRTHEDYGCNSRLSSEVCRFDDHTVYLVSLPIGHNFPLGSPGLQGALQRGGRVVLPAASDTATLFAAIEREHVTVTSLVPALAIRWLEAPERTSYDLSSLRVLQVGGAAIAPEVARRVEPMLGCRLQQVFGMAEGLLNYTRLDDPADEIIGSQGRPCCPDDEIRIVDEHGLDVPTGAAGELLARGPYTIRGYYRADQHNARVFTADGFYRTGDVVRLTPGGNFLVEGRVKDMINRGGEKISAEEIENLVLTHPAVSNAAVVAMPDRVFGERACAYVVLRPGGRLTLAELTEHLVARRIARFKLPERLEVVDSLPLTNVGKVSKATLRADVAEKLRAETERAGTASSTLR